MNEDYNEIPAEEELIWACQYCGIHNTVWVDFTAGLKQDFIEECRICYKPNRILIQIDNDGNIFIESRPVE